MNQQTTHNTENKDERNYFELITEGLKQIEERHEKVIKSLQRLPETPQINNILSELHFTRLQSRGLKDKTKAHFIDYAHLYNEL